jgi:iron(III) transport system permease protein
MTLIGLDSTFWLALGRSAFVGILVSGISLAIGWPLGVRIGLTAFPMRRLLLTMLALPLLLPSFLLAIGLSMLWRDLGGVPAVLWVFASLGIPLVTFAAIAGTLTITRGQSDAARLSNGERHLFRLALRSAFPLAALAAALAGTFTLADPGPGQIFGWRGAASELLTSFAARYDRSIATNQAIAIAVVAALLAWPLVWKLAPQVATGLFSRDVNRFARANSRGTAIWTSLVILFVLLPLAGLFKPLLGRAWPVERAVNEVTRTGVDTFVYAALAAGIAVIIGFSLALFSGRSPSRQRVFVAAALALLALPPALPALWLIPWSNHFTLGFALALRGLPLAILFGLRAVGSMSPSWNDAAKVHGVPARLFAMRVTLPWCRRWAIPAAAVAALLATAEVGTVLLLHPPGHRSLPLAIFTIMANAPEALIATLCLLYVSLALMVGIIGQQTVRRL